MTRPPLVAWLEQHFLHGKPVRFDPRLVLLGFVLLFAGTIGGFTLAGQGFQRADAVAAPVAMLCREGGQTGSRLAGAGACEAADTVAVKPYVSAATAAAAGEDGDDGRPGSPGQAGVAGQPGVAGQTGPAGATGVPGATGAAGAPGAAGTNGAPGLSVQGPKGDTGATGATGPAGSQGVPGDKGDTGATGATGAAGPTCPEGTMLQPVTFASGETGLGCVTTPAGEATP